MQKGVVNRSLSMWRPVTSGVPQRLVLGLILFHIFVSNMNSRVEAPSAYSLMTLNCVLQSYAEGRDGSRGTWT